LTLKKNSNMPEPIIRRYIKIQTNQISQKN
jgi:hypothetical protein